MYPGSCVLGEPMPKVKGIFVSPLGKMAHAAVGFNDCIVEAVQATVRKSPVCKYRDAQILVVVEIPVTAQQYDAGIAVSDKLAGGLAILPLNCSTVYTTVFRAMFPEFMEGQPLSIVTPQTAYEATVQLLNKAL